ncbi:MAG: hypothetical protein GY827_03460, partial [Cytophagales bacterium]|nr:hypothetical protein [Cytophagales bacterium]
MLGFKINTVNGSTPKTNDNTAPIVTKITDESEQESGTNRHLLRATTNEFATCKYSTRSGLSYDSM